MADAVAEQRGGAIRQGYYGRSEMEKRIKEYQLNLFNDRISVATLRVRGSTCGSPIA